MIPPKGLLATKIRYPHLWDRVLRCTSESEVIALFLSIDSMKRPDDDSMQVFIGEWRKAHAHETNAPVHVLTPLIPESFMTPITASTYDMCKLFCTALLLLTHVHRSESVADLSLLESYIRSIATEALRNGPRTPEQLYRELLTIQFRLYAKFAHGLEDE